MKRGHAIGLRLAIAIILRIFVALLAIIAIGIAGMLLQIWVAVAGSRSP